MDDWDALADGFDDEADHGLRDPAVREAWRDLLRSVVPRGARTAADLACGTGSLAILLAEMGIEVTGVDLSPRMLELAEQKSVGLVDPRPTFVRGDAARPRLPAASFDVVLARHILFMLPEPEAVIGRWVELLRPGGVLVLIEGFWSTGSGLRSGECAALVRTHREEAQVLQLASREALWGRPVSDERYLITSTR